MKTLVVGDLHGQIEIAKAAIKKDMPVIFMGDYLDSYVRSVTDQVSTLRYVLDAVEAGQARALIGNHEHSYITKGMRCSGWDGATELHVTHLDLSPLEDYIWAEGFLLSHAGVSNRLLKYMDISLEDYLAEENFYQIGRYRGGRDPVGGLFWCDWNQEFEEVPGIPQIVGHTRGHEIRQKGNSYCVDCLEDYNMYGLIIDNGEAYESKLREA